MPIVLLYIISKENILCYGLSGMSIISGIAAFRKCLSRLADAGMFSARPDLFSPAPQTLW